MREALVAVVVGDRSEAAERMEEWEDEVVFVVPLVPQEPVTIVEFLEIS